MNHHYDDIREKIPEPPQWWDENAVPRYCPFTPDAVADLYAHEVVLAEVTCQGCGHLFRVAFSLNSLTKIPVGHTLADAIRDKALHYGDPPNIGCCAAGPTMNSEPRRVVEYWHTHHKEYVKEGGIVADGRYFDWVRDPMLEVEIVPDWVEI